MTSSLIPQRIKRAKQQITVTLYQDQLAVLDKYGRFIDDSRDYIISQASELVSSHHWRNASLTAVPQGRERPPE